MSKVISGGCLCGAVKFSVNDSFDDFYFCYCQQCRKITGSSHASNLVTSIDNIQWTRGSDKVIRFDHPTQIFTKVFCSQCGSGLPYKSKNGQSLVVPAGSLDSEPSKAPKAQIFCSEKVEWFKKGILAPEYSHYEDESQ